MANITIVDQPLGRHMSGVHYFDLTNSRRFRFHMTGDAIVHRQRFERSRRRTIERFHGSMARLTSELGYSDVDAMGEKHMRGQAPHPLPRNFLSLLTEGFEFLYLRVLRVAARMTSQTKSRGRSPGDQIFFSALMATRAWNVLRDMRLVRKLDRLLDP